MSYDPERALITSVAETRDIRGPVREKVTSSFFSDPLNRSVWDWLLQRYDAHGKVPSLNLLNTHFPKFKPEECDDEVTLVIASVKEKRLYADLQTAAQKVATAARGDVQEALNEFKREASSLAVKYGNTGTLDLSTSAAAVRKQYRKMERQKGMLGIPFPWDAMNKSTRGAQRGSYYALYGDPGTMKTWMLIYILHDMHQNHGQRPLLFVGEMPSEDIMERWAALLAGVDFGLFLDGALSAKEKKRLYRELDRIHEGDSFIVEETDSSGSEALTEIRAKIQEHSATVVGIDGLGDLSANSEWGSWWEVNKGIKSIAKGCRVPIIGTHHTNRDNRKKSIKGQNSADQAAMDASDIALGEAMFRYTDGLFRMYRTPQMEEVEEIGIISKKVRKGKPCHFTVNARPAIDFTQCRVEGEEPVFGKAGEDENEV